jgi:hypothetical protein
VYLTNHLGLPALVVAQLYKGRWRWRKFSSSGSNNTCASCASSANRPMP